MDNPGYDTPADAADRRSSTASDNDVQKPQNGFSTIEPNDDAAGAASYDDDSSRDNEKNSSYPPSYPDTYPSAYKSPDDIEMAERNGQPMRVNHSLDRILSVPEEVEEQRRAEREREPVFYCRWVVERPKTMFFSLLSLAVFMIILTFILIFAGYDAIPIYFDDVPLDIQDNKFLQRGMAWEFRNDDTKLVYERGSDGALRQQQRSQLYETIIFVYRKGGGNVFTPRRLRGIEEHEEEAYYHKDYQKDFCLLDYSIHPNGTCVPGRSVIQLFDGSLGTLTNATGYSYTFNDTEYERIHETMLAARHFDETRSLLDFVMPAKYTLDETEVRASLIRSAFRIGFPLRGYDTDTDDTSDQESSLESYIGDDLLSQLDDEFQDGVKDMDFYYYSSSILTEYVAQEVLKDMTLLIGSLLFIFFFVWLQTRTLFITCFSVLSIVTSFFIANLLYRIVCDFRYFGIFHVLALFIILGIGADNIFVFYDTWRETSHYSFPSVAHRLSYVFRRATLAMLYTSLTTAIAFMVNAASPFLGVNAFGVFAGILVLVNYLSVVIYLPTVVIMYHLYFEKYVFLCFGTSKAPRVTDVHEPTVAVDRTAQGIFVRFFNTYYFYAVTHKIGRWIILAGFAALLTFFVYQAAQLEVDEEQTEFFREDNNIGAYFKYIKDFSTGDEPQRVFIVFGLKKQDLDDCHYSDPDCDGDTVLDKDFYIGVEEQQALLDFCNEIKEMPTRNPKLFKDLEIRIDVLTQEPEVVCFPEVMRQFYESTEPDRNVTDPPDFMTRRRYPEGTNLSFPIDDEKARTIMIYTQWIYDINNADALLMQDNPQDNRAFEIGLEQWLYDGFTQNESNNLPLSFNTYDEIIGVDPNDGFLSTAFSDGTLDYSFRYGSKVRYAAIIVSTKIRGRDLGYEEGVPIRDDWEDFVNDWADRESTPAGLKGAFQCTPVDYDTFDLWHWLDVQQEIVFSAFTGIIVGLACALPILIIATHNFFVGFLATLNIALVTATVLGFIPLMGWKIGILESLNLVLVVGLAVDYCVHLSEGYCRSTHSERIPRVRDALTEVGVSVCSGCITTVGASAFMLLATIRFFTQFGTFLFATLGFSLLYSLGFLPTVLGIIGPEGDFGSIRRVCRFLCGCCPCVRKADSMELSHAHDSKQRNNVL